MIFSKQFLQGTVIAINKKNDNTITQVIRLYRFNNTFLAVLFSTESPSVCVPLFAREQVSFLNSNPIAQWTFTLENGFTVSDISKLASFAESKISLDQNTASFWYSYQPDKTFFDSLSGYIEPEPSVVTLEDPLVLSLTARCKVLQDILDSKGIDYPPFQLI
jgi:hypothetical protein